MSRIVHVWFVVCTFYHPETGEEWGSAMWVASMDDDYMPECPAIGYAVRQMDSEIREKLGILYDASVLNWTAYETRFVPEKDNED